MQPTRVTERIELGSHEGRVGFIMYFQGGGSEAFVFDLATMEQLCRQGLTLVEQVREAERPPLPFRSTVAMADRASVRLMPPKE
jgi:hypothetical protein